MSVHLHLLDQPSSLEISRASADRAALAQALRARPPRPRRTPLVHRVRHALAGHLITTARLVDVR